MLMLEGETEVGDLLLKIKTEFDLEMKAEKVRRTKRKMVWKLKGIMMLKKKVNNN